MKPLVSVIVPVYKVEKYLERCLDSLRRQSMTEIEILLVDDASPDRCGEICDTFATKDNRFRVIHHSKNMGLSVARNTGIGQATCEYLMFVDSDDYVHEDFCKAAYECVVQYQADLVMFRRQHCDTDGHLFDEDRQPACMATEGYKTHQEALDLLHSGVGNVVWNKLYRKELFRTISYPSGYFYEDRGTTYKLILQASCIYFLDRVLYFWCYREGGITTLRTKKALQDKYKMGIQHYRDLEVWGYYSEEKVEMLILSLSLDYCICQKPDVMDSTYVACAKKLRSSVSLKDFTWKQKVLIILFRHCQPLFDMVCMLFGKKVS